MRVYVCVYILKLLHLYLCCFTYINIQYSYLTIKQMLTTRYTLIPEPITPPSLYRLSITPPSLYRLSITPPPLYRLLTPTQVMCWYMHPYIVIMPYLWPLYLISYTATIMLTVSMPPTCVCVCARVCVTIVLYQ